MVKRYANLALLYGGLAMAFGVFYREFTRFRQFSGKTSLSVIHTHYFLLGMFFFLILMLAEKSFSFSGAKLKIALAGYQAGIHITALGLLLRGLMQVQEAAPGRSMDAAVSGISGIGHILTGICMVLILLQIRKKAA